MPQLEFQFQQNGKTTEGPVIETLIHLMGQCNIKYDDIENNQDDPSSISVSFGSQEEAKRAMADLNGKSILC